jgi:hypothetical protein
MHVTRRPRLAARYRAARLGLAALLGLLFGSTAIGVEIFLILPRNPSVWPLVVPLFAAAFLPPALSLCLDAPVRRSRRVLLGALVALALFIAALPLVNSVFIDAIGPISTANFVVGVVLTGIYFLSIPLLLAAAAAFTVGGLGGYAARWALTAVGAGALAWTGAGVAILPLAYALDSVVHPCQGVSSLCWGPSLVSFAAVLFVLGLAVAPLGGLLGGSLRAWVGRMAHAS